MQELPKTLTKQEQQQFFAALQIDYRNVFESPAGRRVLEDLKIMCFGYNTPFHSDPYVHACNAGMNEVFRHIEAMSRPQPKQETKPPERAITS